MTEKYSYLTEGWGHLCLLTSELAVFRSSVCLSDNGNCQVKWAWVWQHNSFWPINSLRFSGFNLWFHPKHNCENKTTITMSITITTVIFIGKHTMSHIWTFQVFVNFCLRLNVYHDIWSQQRQNAEEGMEEWNGKTKTDVSIRVDLWLSHTLWISTFPRLWHMNPRPPPNPSHGGKSSRCLGLSFSSLYPNQAPLFSLAPKNLSSWNSFLSFWPKCACVARNRDEATASWRGGVMKTNGP